MLRGTTLEPLRQTAALHHRWENMWVWARAGNNISCCVHSDMNAGVGLTGRSIYSPPINRHSSPQRPWNPSEWWLTLPPPPPLLMVLVWGGGGSVNTGFPFSSSGESGCFRPSCQVLSLGGVSALPAGGILHCFDDWSSSSSSSPSIHRDVLKADIRTGISSARSRLFGGGSNPTRSKETKAQWAWWERYQVRDDLVPSSGLRRDLILSDIDSILLESWYRITDGDERRDESFEDSDLENGESPFVYLTGNHVQNESNDHSLKTRFSIYSSVRYWKCTPGKGLCYEMFLYVVDL